MTEVAAPSRPAIVCFSHLAWDPSLYQRPQQIMSRLGTLGHTIYYFACVGHKRHSKAPMAGPLEGVPNVFVYTLPYAPGIRRFHGPRRWLAGLRVASVLAKQAVRRPVLWFYHPSLFALGYSHSDAAIVYDVMDHFPSFEESVDDCYFDELALLAESDVVFTGGRSLDRHIRTMLNELQSDAAPTAEDPTPKKLRQPSASLPPAFCYPSGVDLDHFSMRHPHESTAPGLAPPRFGYFGAIDERIDWDLITALAGATTGSVILQGPVLRPPPDGLPTNVYLPGPAQYQDLPRILAGFDVCLIPFRNTSLVQFISPTKTPEYLAGGKPVVSTPIPDVVTDYGDVVSIAADTPAFVAACLQLAAAPPAPQALAAEARARARTWDQIAAAMAETLSDTVAKSEA